MNRLVIQHIDVDEFVRISQGWKVFAALLRLCVHSSRQVVCWRWYTSIRTIGDREIHVLDIGHNEYLYHPSDQITNIEVKRLDAKQIADPRHRHVLKKLNEKVDGSWNFIKAVPHIGEVTPLWANVDFWEDIEDGNPTK